MKDNHIYGFIREFAERKAMIARQEAQAWDILARDILREKHRSESERSQKPVQPKISQPEAKANSENKLFVGIKEARKIMGIGNTSIYKEIKEGRLPVKKHGRINLISMKDIHAWFEALPDK